MPTSFYNTNLCSTPPCTQFKLPMQHNPYEIGQPWRPPGGLFRARQCASSFVCPPLRSKPQTFVNFLKMPLHFQIFCWPRPRPPPPTAAVTCVATSVMLLMRLLAGGSTASTPSDPLDPLNSEI
uniref:Uncharacterized protein n=1 Tax=Chlamydomonas euryale TaxID=1486919 RepID=A0A7R9V4H8_9CHLO